MLRFDVLGTWYEFSGWRSGGGSSLFVDLPVSAFISYFFSFGLGCAAAPVNLVVSCGCYINIAGRKPVLRESQLPQERERDPNWLYNRSGVMNFNIYKKLV
jgi:hypothetical protein